MSLGLKGLSEKTTHLFFPQKSENQRAPSIRCPPEGNCSWGKLARENRRMSNGGAKITEGLNNVYNQKTEPTFFCPAEYTTKPKPNKTNPKNKN